jgi:hypothetical protein
MSLRFCPVCKNYLYLQNTDSALNLACHHCGYNTKFEPKSSEEALILETTFAVTGAGAKQTVPVLNEYTKLDPTMPRLTTVACPNAACPSQADPAKRDVLYIKTDAQNLKYQYCCRVCDTQWSS